MFDYLQKFNNLPADLRAKISSPSVMAFISELEKKYQVDLAVAVMKVMTKDLTIKNLSPYFAKEFNLNSSIAENLVKDLKEKVFVSVANYLGLESELKALDLAKNINLFIQEAGIVLPSSVLVKRFQSIIEIYLKGIRNKIDTRNTLAKNIKIGGLNLSEEEIERVLKICDSKKFILEAKSSGFLEKNNLVDRTVVASNDKTVSNNKNDKTIVSPEYNLKQAISRGEVSKIVKTKKEELAKEDNETLEISAPDKQVDLPLEKSRLKIGSTDSSQILKKDFSKPSAEFPKVSKDISQDIPKDISSENQPSVISKLVSSPKNKSAVINESGLALEPLKVESLESSKLKSSSAPSTNASKSALNLTPPITRSFKKTSFWSKLGFSKKNNGFKKTSSASVSTPSPAPTSTSNPTPSPALTLSDFSTPVSSPLVSKAKTSEIKATSISSKKAIITEANGTVLNSQSSKNISPTLKSPSLRPAPTPSVGRPAMQDIKAMPKIMGPIEELKFLDIVNFRRLAKTPSEATAKILTKIKLLEEDGYDKMVAGVLAWRQSPLNRSYLRLGQEALNKNLTLKAYIDSLSKTDQAQLNFAEIEALVNLNKKLVF